MELSGSKIKKFLIFYYISGSGNFLEKLPLCQEMKPSSLRLSDTLFKPKLKKQNNSPQENFLYSWKMELPNFNIKFFFYISSKESCPNISGNGNPKIIPYNFSKEIFSYILQKEKTKKTFYISGNRTLLCFRKKKL